jgi:lysophospholipase L1-like esterase
VNAPHLLLIGSVILFGIGCNRRPPAGTPGTLRFLALGDSYTIGEGVEPDERWPVQLAGMLRNEGFDVGDPTVIARTGWTTGDLSAGIDRAAPAGRYDLVSLLIGVNNQYRGGDPDAYRREFVALLNRAAAFAGGDPSRVLVVSIPDWGVTPFAAGQDGARVAAEIDRFNAINREEARRAGARYVDVTPASRRDRGAVVADGLHPSAAMYAEWARLALPEARAALRQPASPGDAR